MDGVWNGTYEIRFSGVTAHFTQFGEPSSQVITVRSNVITLKFEDFVNVDKAAGDGVLNLDGREYMGVCSGGLRP